MSEGITIKEFKMWLEGVEEMQPEGWTPDERQWKRIREKLETIIESVTAPQQSVVLHRNVQEELPVQRYTGPVQLATPGLTPLISAPQPNNALFGNADNPSNPVRTPNLDTSSGTYEPAFI